MSGRAMENIGEGRDKGRKKGEKEKGPCQSKERGAGHFDPIPKVCSHVSPSQGRA